MKYFICMFGFLFKKNFCDIWDNLFHLVCVNLVHTALILGGLYGFFAIAGSGMQDGPKIIALWLFVIFFCMVFHVFLFAEGKNAEKISNYSAPKLSAFFANIVSSIKDGVLFGLFFGLVIIVSFVSIPYYLRMAEGDGTGGSFLGLVIAFFIFWILILVLLALQWFMAVRNVLHNGFRKCLKKSFILLFDNFWLTVGMALINLLNIVVTIFTVSLIPGFAGIQVCVTNALHLRMYKYDWYEVNPGMSKAQKKHVPWDQLLVKDRKLLGSRKLKSFLFPWKE